MKIFLRNVDVNKQKELQVDDMQLFGGEDEILAELRHASAEAMTNSTRSNRAGALKQKSQVATT